MHTQFKKGVSGNPRGGSRKVKLRRARLLAIKEAYRRITVREGDKVMRVPAIQAVMRSQVALAVKGNGPAQRTLIAAVHALEQEILVEFDEAQKPGLHSPSTANGKRRDGSRSCCARRSRKGESRHPGI